jgi:hypothetical protein
MVPHVPAQSLLPSRLTSSTLTSRRTGYVLGARQAHRLSSKWDHLQNWRLLDIASPTLGGGDVKIGLYDNPRKLCTVETAVIRQGRLSGRGRGGRRPDRPRLPEEFVRPQRDAVVRPVFALFQQSPIHLQLTMSAQTVALAGARLPLPRTIRQ